MLRAASGQQPEASSQRTKNVLSLVYPDWHVASTSTKIQQNSCRDPSTFKPVPSAKKFKKNCCQSEKNKKQKTTSFCDGWFLQYLIYEDLISKVPGVHIPIQELVPKLVVNKPEKIIAPGAQKTFKFVSQNRSKLDQQQTQQTNTLELEPYMLKAHLGNDIRCAPKNDRDPSRKTSDIFIVMPNSWKNMFGIFWIFCGSFAFCINW